MIDAFADGKRKRKRGEREEKGLYIPDALSGQDGRTDLHQGNHDYTSYGKSLYTRVYRFIDESVSVFRFALRRNISRGGASKNHGW